MSGLMEQAALLALLRAQRTGWNLVADEVEERGSALEVLRDPEAQSGPGQGALFGRATSSIDPRAALEQAVRELEAWTSRGVGLVTLLDEGYPRHLLTIHERPPFLFYRGRLDEGDARSVAVVGTRKPTDAGLRRAARIAAGLAKRGTTVVSGLAAGIDTAAHLAALGEGGRTVAVIGTGILRYYPAANRELQDRIGRDHLVLSQFWPDTTPPNSFLMRNAVMSGYAAATVVVEAAYRSGARAQAGLALRHGRPVFLLQSLMCHDWARDYQQRGAYVVNDADDVLAILDTILAPPVQLAWT